MQIKVKRRVMLPFDKPQITIAIKFYILTVGWDGWEHVGRKFHRAESRLFPNFPEFKIFVFLEVACVTGRTQSLTTRKNSIHNWFYDIKIKQQVLGLIISITSIFQIL